MNTFGESQSILSMALSTGPVVAGVLIILVFSSVVSWAVIAHKWRVISRATRQSRVFVDAFFKSDDLPGAVAATRRIKDCPLAEILRAGYEEWQRVQIRIAGRRSAVPEEVSLQLGVTASVERTLRRTSAVEVNHLQRMLIFLASVASAAPFIGLFGTVWGIMDSFREIGVTGSANLAVVAPGISEALITTAFGLAAAIPAVVAYNYLNNGVRLLSAEMDTFSTELLDIVTHHAATTPRGGL